MPDDDRGMKSFNCLTLGFAIILEVRNWRGTDQYLCSSQEKVVPLLVIF